MFRKLLSRLPFQPSLLKEVSIYKGTLTKNLKKRKIGLLLIAIGFGLQIFILAIPVSSSMQTHPADTVFGASTKGDLLTSYRRNQDQLGRSDIQAIFNYYGIAEAQLRNAEPTLLGGSLNDYITSTRYTSSIERTFINIPGAADSGIYEMPLKDWAQGGNSVEFEALTGLSSYGIRFWILLNGSGNVVTEKGARKPNLEVHKDIFGNGVYSIDEDIKFIIRFRNNGDAAAKNVTLTDTLPKGLTFESFSSNLDLSITQHGSRLSWVIDNNGSSLATGENWHYIELITKAKDSFDKACTETTIESDEAVIAKSNILNACLAVSKNSVQQNVINNVDLIATKDSFEEPALALSHKVSNISQQNVDANNTTVKPGDTLQYSISVRNVSDNKLEKIEDNAALFTDITDILEYASVVEVTGGLQSESRSKILWDTSDIPPWGTIEHSFKVQVNEPFPNTPVSTSNPNSYNAVISSIYGNSVDVMVAKTYTKTLEQTLYSLPMFSSVLSAILLLIILLLSIYYYIRTKLMAKELEIVHKDFSSGGS